jgi:hypothetical protein
MQKISIQHVVLFTIRNDWGENYADTFSKLLEDSGIETRIIYYSDNSNVDLLPYTKALANHIFNKTNQYGEEHVAGQLIDNARIQDVLSRSHEEFSDIIWFGTTDTAYYPLPKEHNTPRSVVFVSPVPHTYDKQYVDFNKEMELNYDFQASYYGAAAYDACWLYALAIIETGSTEVGRIKEALPAVAQDYQGISGLCTLNDKGDRVSTDYKLMGYNYIDGGFEVIGRYNYSNQTVTFTKIHPKIPTD